MEQTLSSYRAFYEVAAAGNISKAADSLYISQPALSKSIKKLEQNLGAALFYRTSKGVTLTSEGELLYRHVKSAFDELHQGEEQLRVYHKFGMGQLKIGVSSTLCKYILMPHLDNYLSFHPNVQVTIDCQSSNQTLEMLQQDKIDLGLIGIDRPLPYMYFHSMGQIHDIFVCKPSYLENLKEREGTSAPSFLNNATIILLDKNNLSRRYIDSHITSHNFTIPHTLEVSTMDMLIEFSKVGLGIGCVIREFVQNELKVGELMEVPMGFTIPPREIGYVISKSHNSHTAHDFLTLCEHNTHENS